MPLAFSLWALLPALVWWYFGEPRTFMVLLGSLGLAALLRASESWVRVLLVSVALGLLYAVVLGAVFREPIEAIALELQKLLPQVLEGFYQQLSVDERARLASLIAPVLTGLIAALLQIVSVLSLILGRYWQALLYNPGGFGREFRSLRLPLGTGDVAAGVHASGAEFRSTDGHADTVVQRTAGVRRTGLGSRSGRCKATDQLLAGGVVRNAVAVHAADLSVAGAVCHCRQPD